MSAGQFAEGAPPRPPVVRCPECGADVFLGAKRCWLCKAYLASSRPVKDVDVQRPQGRDWALIAFMSVLATLLVFGLVQEAPGLLIFVLVVLLGPALFALVATPQ